MPYRNGNKVWNATEWTDEMIIRLKASYSTMTNQQLAAMLGLRLTVVRNKCRELGLKKMEPEYWSEEMIQYLKDNYKTKGDVEIMEYFKIHFPKEKGWKRGAIWKKRKQIKLQRSDEEKKLLASKNATPGGASYTIDKNSSSKNMHPVWIAQRLAWRDKEMQDELLKNPGVIELGKALIKLKRTLKNVQGKES